MDEISQGPDKDGRLPRAPRWLPAAALAGLVAVAAALTVTRFGGHDSTAAPATPTATKAQSAPTAPALAAPSPVPQLAAAGTVLLTCDSASPGKVQPDWRAGSLQVGTLWLVDGRRLRYARLGRAGRVGQTPQGASAPGGQSRQVEMLVHVDAGATVVMRAAAGTSPYFEFLNSPASVDDYQGDYGGRGYTFVPCSASDAGHGGTTDFYDVGFSIVPGRAASVEVWTSTDARPLWLTFTAPAKS